MKSLQSTPLHAGEWTTLTLDVSPQGFRWMRDGGAQISVTDSRFRGGYVHIGSTSVDGALRLRGLSLA